jgi:hypothetical protein
MCSGKKARIQVKRSLSFKGVPRACPWGSTLQGKIGREAIMLPDPTQSLLFQQWYEKIESLKIRPATKESYVKALRMKADLEKLPHHDIRLTSGSYYSWKDYEELKRILAAEISALEAEVEVLEEEKQASQGRSFQLPSWLTCLPAEWQNLMCKIDVEFDVNQGRYNWDKPLWAARLVIHLMVQKRQTKNKPALHKAFDDLFFKIGRNGEPMTLHQLQDALRSKSNSFKGKTEYLLYKKVKSYVDEVFYPAPHKADMKLR